MPIILIWDLAALPWIAPFNRWMRDFDVAGRLLEKWIKRQLATAEGIDRLTSDFPVFRFYNMAVSAEISRIQFGSIVPSPDSQFGHQMGRVGQAWNLPDTIDRRITESTLLIGVIDVFGTIASSVLDSIDRMATPRAEMFEPDAARVTDLPGLLALLFNTVGSNRAGILAAGTGLAEGLGISPAPAGSGGAGGAAASPAPATDMATTIIAAAADFTAKAETILQYVAGGLLLVPAIGALILSMGQDIVLALRLAVLDQLEAIERSLMAWRRDFYTRFYRAITAYADGTLLFMLAIRDAGLDQIRYWSEFGVAYLGAIADGVGAFATQLQSFWTSVGGLIQAMVDYLGRIMAIDIGPVIHNALVLFQRIIDFFGDELWNDPDDAPRYSAPGSFAVSIGDFATGTGTGATARDQLALAGSTLQASIRGANFVSVGVNMGLGSWASGKFLPGLAAGAIQLTQILRTPMAPIRTQPSLTFAGGSVPDLSALVVEPLRTGLTTAVADIGTSVQTSVADLFTAVGALADGVALRAEASALEAVRLGSLGHYHAIVAGSESIVARAFPDLPASAPTGLEAVAEAYALWLSGAFEMIGSLMGGFLTMLIDEWTSRIDANEDATFEASPTSPRKLLARAQLGTVRLPELRIVMAGPVTAPNSANDVADSFQQAVRDAYRAGGRRLDEYRSLAASTAI